LALEPLGHIAGIANSVIGSFQTLLSVVIGGVVGQAYDGSVTSLVLGFVFCGVTSLVVVTYTMRQNQPIGLTVGEK
jgi:DHA1 family bicyclomycin/chloramphenicol resistance-like MFS transporter